MRNKREKFVELATRRVNRAIRELRLVGNLANKASYDYGAEDAKKIIRALTRELDALRARYGGSGNGSDSEFTL